MGISRAGSETNAPACLTGVCPAWFFAGSCLQPELLTIAGIINTFEYFGFMVREGDPDGLLPRINAALGTLGLTVVEATGGLQELVIADGSFIDSLLKIYFEPAPADVTAAWVANKDLILSGDLDGFIAGMMAALGL